LTIAADLVALTRAAGRHPNLPRIDRVFVPPLQPDPPRDAEFGLISLEDGSAGFFYAWLGRTQERLRLHPGLNRLAGTPVLDLAERFDGGDEVDTAIGIGAISAVYQHLLRSSRYQPDTTTNSMARMRFGHGDRVGMVGYFPPLVEKLRALRVPLTVIEKKAELVGITEGVEVTLDSARLGGCNKVLCTAATLLNHTLDEVLTCCPDTSTVAIIGPTAGCFPDPLFQRGVNIIGGSQVIDLDKLLSRLERGEPWGDAVRKYTIEANAYPGSATLMESNR
jgi:uncharacterized protein (DUF4213/DUF364 family)